METIIINANGTSAGRLASYVAKKALGGNEVVVVDSEKAIISGNKQDIIKKYKALVLKGGHSLKGPKIIRSPERILKRMIRGMLPDYREGQGRIAFKKIKCYLGISEEFKDKQMLQLKINKPKKFIELKELSEKL